MAADLDPARAVADLRALRELTGDERGAQRLAWTDTWARARAWLRERLAELPVEVDADEAGNLWARLPGASERTVLLGSHVDSVPDGGWLDGALGCSAGSRSCARSRPPASRR
jgi:acetylornithine deacetylase/succinyl-diaminopimelate desuccinylase-like protein